MTNRLLYLFIATLAAGSASAQSFRIHRGMEVTETREPITFSEHADADYIEVRGATFDLSVTDVTQTSCTLHVTPSNDEVSYYYDICTRETLDGEFHGDVATLIEGYIQRLYAQYGTTFSLEEILAETLSMGADEDDLRGLPAGTEMAFYAMAVDDEGHCVGEPALTFFTTDPAGDPKDCTYAIDVSHVRSDGCLVSISPSDASVPYWYGICAVDEWPGDYAMTTDVSDAIYEYAKEYGISISSVASRVVYTGDISMEESGLNTNTAYYAYCYAMDTETGDALGPVTKVRFETLDYDLSNADIALDVKYYDGDALMAAYPERFTTSISGRCYMQVVVTPNPYCYNWAVALAKGDLTDGFTYPEETTKNAVLQGGKLSHEVNNFVCDWSECTLFGFGVDAVGIDGPLQRILVTPSRSGVSPVSEFITEVSASSLPIGIPAFSASTGMTPGATGTTMPTADLQSTKLIINNKYNHYEKVHLHSAPGHRRSIHGLGRGR